MPQSDTRFVGMWLFGGQNYLGECGVQNMNLVETWRDAQYVDAEIPSNQLLERLVLKTSRLKTWNKLMIKYAKEFFPIQATCDLEESKDVAT